MCCRYYYYCCYRFDGELKHATTATNFTSLTLSPIYYKLMIFWVNFECWASQNYAFTEKYALHKCQIYTMANTYHTCSAAFDQFTFTQSFLGNFAEIRKLLYFDMVNARTYRTDLCYTRCRQTNNITINMIYGT